MKQEKQDRVVLTHLFNHAVNKSGKPWLVGARGFEPPTPASRTRCATELRYAPTTLLAFVHSFRTSSSQGNPCASATAGYVISP